MAVYSSTQAPDGQVARAYSIATSESSTVTPIVDSSGNLTIPGNATVTGNESVTGVLTVLSKFQLGGIEGAANSIVTNGVGKTAIVDATATSIITITVTNVNASFVMRVINISATTAASHIYDSTRVVEYFVVGTRVAGANLVCGISAAVGAQIATVSGGRTLTSTLALSSVTGAVGATNTIDIQVTNTSSVAGTSACDLVYEFIALSAGVTAALSA